MSWSECILSNRATTLHLKFETTLSICLTLLTTSSLVCIYRSTFGTLGDWKTILVSNLWLSRHLFFRMLCTGTMSTTFMHNMTYAVMAPWIGFKRNLGLWLVKYCSSGQYFDAPSQAAILAASGGGDHNNNHTNYTFQSSFSYSIPHKYFLMPLIKSYLWMISMKHTKWNNENWLSNLFNFRSHKKSKKQNKHDNSVDIKNNNNHSNSRRSKIKSSNVNSNNNNRTSVMSQDQALQQILNSKQYKQIEQLWENLPPPQLTIAIILGIICITAIIIFHPNTFTTNIPSVNYLTSHDRAFPSNNKANFNHFHNNDPTRSKNHHNNHGIKDHVDLGSGDIPGHSNIHPNHQNSRNGKLKINFNYPTAPDSSINIAPYMKSYAEPPRTFFSDPFNLHSSEPTFLKLFMFMASCGTLCSLISYGRVILPIPDLTASVKTTESVKQLSKSNQSQSSRIRNQVGGGNVSNSGGIGFLLSSFFMSSNSKNMNSSSKKKDKDIPWAERFRSIRHENKLFMILNIMFLRIIENIVVCAILPHTFMVCRITTHCDRYPLLWERAGSFAIDSWRVAGQHGIGKDASIMTSFDSIEVDSLVKFLIMVSVVFITISLLLAQSVTLDRAYLSTLGFLSGEMITDQNSTDLNERDIIGSSSSIDKQTNNSGRRHKKGGSGNHGSQNSSNYSNRNIEKDLIASRYGNEGKQINYIMKVAYYLFRHDLGHPSTSTVISRASIIHVLFIVCLINVLMYYKAMGYDYMALSILILANMTAIHGMCSIGIMDYREIRILSEEISS